VVKARKAGLDGHGNRRNAVTTVHSFPPKPDGSNPPAGRVLPSSRSLQGAIKRELCSLCETSLDGAGGSGCRKVRRARPDGNCLLQRLQDLCPNEPNRDRDGRSDGSGIRRGAFRETNR
jgi:hypothetical protein